MDHLLSASAVAPKGLPVILPAPARAGRITGRPLGATAEANRRWSMEIQGRHLVSNNIAPKSTSGCNDS